MSTLSTCTHLLPRKGEIGRERKSGVGQQQFETEQATTLRFFGVWEHSTRQFGDKAPLLLHYFLKDNTLELRQLQQNAVHKHAFAAALATNDSATPFPPVIKRMKIPKPGYHSALQASSGGLRPMRPDEGFYHWKDIMVGRPLQLLGKNLLIMEADEATEAFYAAQGVSAASMLPMQMDSLRYPCGPALADPDSPYAKMDKNTVALMKSVSIKRSGKHSHQPASSEAPSMLRATATKPTQFMNYTGRGTPAMRFKAGLVSAPGFTCSAADQERRFLLTFYLQDNTLAISEPPNKLTRTGGPSFYVRQVTCKPPLSDPYNPKDPYTASDFYIGALVPILLKMRTGYEAEGPKMLQLLEADTWTLDFMESRPSTFPMADFEATKNAMLSQLSEGTRAQDFVQLMVQADTKSCGFVYRKALYGLLKEVGCDVCMHSVVTVARQLDSDGAGVSHAAMIEEFSLPPYRQPTDAAGRPSSAMHAAHGHMAMTMPMRAQTAASSVKPSKYGAANANSSWASSYAADRVLTSHRIGVHTFGPDPWHDPYYNRRELGTHLITAALTQKQSDRPTWA